MSYWQENELTPKIFAILAGVAPRDTSRHFGRPFLTAHQLAIEFTTRHPIEAAAIGPAGGLGIGEQSRLAQYLAEELLRRIGSGELPQIEAGFLSNQHLNAKSEYDLSMFRLRS